MVGTVSFFDGFVLLKASRSQIHLLPEWQLWGFFFICVMSAYRGAIFFFSMDIISPDLDSFRAAAVGVGV